MSQPTTAAFYAEATECWFQIATEEGPYNCLGRRTHIPGWPSLKFFLHTKHKDGEILYCLTEASTGLLACSAGSRQALHAEVRFRQSLNSEARVRELVAGRRKLNAPALSV